MQQTEYGIEADSCRSVKRSNTALFDSAGADDVPAHFDSDLVLFQKRPGVFVVEDCINPVIVDTLRPEEDKFLFTGFPGFDPVLGIVLRRTGDLRTGRNSQPEQFGRFFLHAAQTVLETHELIGREKSEDDQNCNHHEKGDSKMQAA